MESQFQKDLTILINSYCKENDSDTPDFILAQYLNAVLENFNAAVKQREEHYGRQKHIIDLPENTEFPIDHNNTGILPNLTNYSSGTPSETNLSNDSDVMKTLNAKEICEGPNFENGV